MSNDTTFIGDIVGYTPFNRDTTQININADVDLKDNTTVNYYGTYDYTNATVSGLPLTSFTEYYNDMRVPVTSTKTGGSKDPTFKKIFDNGAGSQGVFAYAFSKTSEEELYFTAQLPHGYKAGTDLDAHLHFIDDGLDANTAHFVRFGLEHTWASVDGTFSNTSIIYGNYTDLSADAGKHRYLDLGDINGTGQTFSSMLICRVFRDATNDDYDQEAFLLEVDFHYLSDSHGTTSEMSK